ncbi:DUF2214 family protein [Massilia sp. BJB1822]|uniref:DUF2214 family protein n=1 Tax=Massilia sp. BJB1822 TaxID=2744470 RepID=UPI001594584C|nr:DUF2214 family protein [Massilia sp. BJB1822]NVD99745.1 DUF2214 family protein [Massilia sp. BJB1822]
MSDFLQASLHHLLVFTIAAVLACEWALLRPGLAPATLRLLARLDAAYGLSALGILLVGFGRVMHGAKGAAFYTANPLFWTKIGVFALVGLLSIKPTLRILAWQKRLRADAGFVPSSAEIAALRPLLLAELLLFAAIPVLAAAMARGIGHV